MVNPVVHAREAGGIRRITRARDIIVMLRVVRRFDRKTAETAPNG
jgi:hypothetical protein